jgi:hypothetical protein
MIILYYPISAMILFKVLIFYAGVELLYFSTPSVFLNYVLSEVLVEVFAVMELGTEVNELLSLGLAMFAFSIGTEVFR